MNREERIQQRLASAIPMENPNGGTDCLVLGQSRPWITVDGKQILMARYIVGIENAGTLVVAMHSCDNPPCVNPPHLSAGSQGQNLRDAWARGLR